MSRRSDERRAAPSPPDAGADPSHLATAAAVRRIRDGIARGEHAPGARLKEVDLAEKLGISRTPIREALRTLASEGLVIISPNRGAVVRAYNPSELEDIYQLRAVLEGYAARRAAAAISVEQIDALRESCERFDALLGQGAPLDFVEENMRFHRTVLEAARSERLTAMVLQVIELPLVYKSYTWYSPQQTNISAHHHRQLLRALSSHDGDRAEAIMKEHVFEARDFLVATLRADDKRQRRSDARRK